MKEDNKKANKYKKEAEELRHSCNAFKLTIKGLEIERTAANMRVIFYTSRFNDVKFLKRRIEELSIPSSQEQQ